MSLSIVMESDQTRLLPISVKDLVRDLRPEQLSTAGTTPILLVDVRPNAQFCNGHIESAENVNFSNILLRRLLKGVVSLESLLPSTELAERIKSLEGHASATSTDESPQKLVVYDWCSNEDGVKVELAKHAEILATASSSRFVYFLNGGYDAFSAESPNLCRQQQESKRKVPLGISVSTSLPVGFSGYRNKMVSRRPLLTPSEDDPNRFGPPVEILPYLVLGCAKDSADLTQLRKMGITAILNVSHNCPNHYETLFEYKCIPVEDSHQADLLSKLETAFDFINSIKQKGGCVFVHCHAGISRSATVCIAYIMKHHQKDLTQAYDFVKQRRPCISPNLHFMGQLLEFQKCLQSATSDCVSDSACGGNEDGIEEEMDCSTCNDSLLPTPLPKDRVTIDYTAQFSTTVSTSPRQDLLLCNSTGEQSHQIPVSIPHQQASDCSAVAMCSKRSIRVPGSLNFTLAKPKRKNISASPKFPVKYNQSILEIHCSTDSVLHSHSASTMTVSRPTKLNLTSISLPTTPINQSGKTHHLSISSNRSKTPGVSNSRLRHALQLSPCRVVAKNWPCFPGQSSPIPTTIA